MLQAVALSEPQSWNNKCAWIAVPKKCHPYTALLFRLTEPDGTDRLPSVPELHRKVLILGNMECVSERSEWDSMSPSETQRSSEALNGPEGAGHQRWGADSNRDQWGLNTTAPRRGEGLILVTRNLHTVNVNLQDCKCCPGCCSTCFPLY